MSSSYHIEQKTFIEAQAVYKITYTLGKKYFAVATFEGFIFRASKKTGIIIWSV